MPLHLQSLLGFSTQLLLFLILLNCSWLLESGLINCGARLGPFFHLCVWLPRYLHQKWIHYFSSHPAAFEFWSSTPPDNITLTPANRKVDQSLSRFQTGIGAAASATLDMKQFISCLSVAFVDTISSLLDSEGDIISVSEVHDLLIKVHGILGNALSKQVGISAHILAHVFNSASRQHYEVWASQFPFLNSLKDVVPPSEACLYDHINWSLTQAQQQSSMGLSQSFPPRRGSKTTPRTGLHFSVQKRSVLESSDASLSLSVLLILGRRGAMGVDTLDVSQSTAFLSSSPSVLQAGMPSQFLDQGRTITSNSSVFNMVQGQHLQLR